MPRPKSITLRSYDVGFGDCYLLTFHYADGDRHVLIDFGSTRPPAGVKSAGAYMEEIAAQIARDCEGKLTAVVATHRHKDHISGFTMKDGKGPGAIIRGLRPELVIQPWTEDPDAARDAKKPTKRLPAASTRAKRAAHVGALRDMNVYAGHVEQVAKRLGGKHLAAVRDQLAFLGEDGKLPNRDAVVNLMTMGKRKPRYVYFGAKSGLETLLPGVTTHVLGPPTLEQTDTIAKQRSKDKDQFWLTQRARATFWAQRAAIAKRGDGAPELLFPDHVRARRPWDGGWHRYHAQLDYAEGMLSIVRSLDAQMNNTSVILLFEVKGKLLLFPGDAQYENWMYALSQSGVREKLSKVSLYKVGHHGSLNATPKDLWNGFTRRGGVKKQDRLVSFLSTLDHVHGKTEATAVPRKTLVEALQKESTLFDTRDGARHGHAVSHTLVLD